MPVQFIRFNVAETKLLKLNFNFENELDYLGYFDAANSASFPTLFYANAVMVGVSPGGLYLANTTSNTTIKIPSTSDISSNYLLRADGTWVAGGGGGGTPGGSNTHIQFNDSGAFGGNSALTFDKTAVRLSVGNSTVNSTINTSGFYISGVAVGGGTVNTTAIAFRAYKTANQTFSNTTATKVTFGTEYFDVGNCYDTTNSRWTPPPGPVELRAVAYFRTITGTYADCELYIYKNGGLLGQSFFNATAHSEAEVTTSVLDVASGTDYYECYAYVGTSSNGSTPNIVGTSSAATYFEGTTLGSATLSLNAVSSISIGNSTVNTSVNSTGFSINGNRIGEQVTNAGSLSFSSSGTAALCGTLTLPAGNWLIEGYSVFGGPGATTSSDWNFGVFNASATISGANALTPTAHTRLPSGADMAIVMPTLPRIFSPSTSTTYYFNASATYVGGGGYSVNWYALATRVST